MHFNILKLDIIICNFMMQLFIFWSKRMLFGGPRGEIGRHKGLKLNLSASGESLNVEPSKFGEGLTANTEPRHSRNVRCRD